MTTVLPPDGKGQGGMILETFVMLPFALPAYWNEFSMRVLP